MAFSRLNQGSQQPLELEHAEVIRLSESDLSEGGAAADSESPSSPMEQKSIQSTSVTSQRVEMAGFHARKSAIDGLGLRNWTGIAPLLPHATPACPPFHQRLISLVDHLVRSVWEPRYKVAECKQIPVPASSLAFLQCDLHCCFCLY